jgi:hypothetical protein
MITVLELTNPSLPLQKRVIAFSRHCREFSVRRFVSEALEEEKLGSNLLFDPIYLMS